MTNTNTTSISVLKDKETIMRESKEAGKVYSSALMRQDEVTAKELYDAKEALDKLVCEYNDASLKESYDDLLGNCNPIIALCSRFAWGKLYTSAQTDKTSKTISIQFNSRRTRFSLLDFLAYAEKEGYQWDNTTTIRNVLTLTARTLSDYIIGCVTKDKSVSMADAKSALSDLVTAIGLKDVHARSVDVRFVSFAVTKARDLGELAVVTDASVAPYLMDMFHVQLNNLEYKFEDKKNEK